MAKLEMFNKQLHDISVLWWGPRVPCQRHVTSARDMSRPHATICNNLASVIGSYVVRITLMGTEIC